LLGRASLEVGLDSQGNRDLIVFQLAQAIGANLVLPELGPQGFKFMRAQLLDFNDEPLAQLLYLGASGAPLALYAKKGEGNAAPQFRRYGEIAGVSWSQGGLVYLLAGEESEQSLFNLADAISKKEMAPASDTAPAPSPPPPLPKPKPKP
jgi:anti-sigma factor RsiW